MTCFARNLIKLISAQPFCVLIVLLELSIIGLTAQPSSSCCYDPPDYADTAEQAQPPSSDLPSEASQDTATVPDVPKEAQFSLYSGDPSEQQDPSTAGIGVQNFALIRQFMADGQYLRAKRWQKSSLRHAHLILSFGDFWR